MNTSGRDYSDSKNIYANTYLDLIEFDKIFLGQITKANDMQMAMANDENSDQSIRELLTASHRVTMEVCREYLPAVKRACIAELCGFYTLDELAGLVAFAKTPLGKKCMNYLIGMHSSEKMTTLQKRLIQTVIYRLEKLEEAQEAAEEIQ
jgi:hypothetical protein